MQTGLGVDGGRLIGRQARRKMRLGTGLLEHQPAWPLAPTGNSGPTCGGTRTRGGCGWLWNFSCPSRWLRPGITITTTARPPVSPSCSRPAGPSACLSLGWPGSGLWERVTGAGGRHTARAHIHTIPDTRHDATRAPTRRSNVANSVVAAIVVAVAICGPPLPVSASRGRAVVRVYASRGGRGTKRGRPWDGGMSNGAQGLDPNSIWCRALKPPTAAPPVEGRAGGGAPAESGFVVRVERPRLAGERKKEVAESEHGMDPSLPPASGPTFSQPRPDSRAPGAIPVVFVGVAAIAGGPRQPSQPAVRRRQQANVTAAAAA
jgi:hypothetical protein